MYYIKKKFRLLVFNLFFIAMSVTLQAQSKLNIGDTIPANLEITNLKNYPTSTLRLADLKGKLVILDFWATWCSACIAAFPKMEAIQEQFKKELQVIMINSDTSETPQKVADFLTRLKERTGESLTLPYAVRSLDILPCFPHREVPHYVWINANGKIIGITNAEDVNAQNITEVLNNKTKILYTKRDDLRFNGEKPLLIDENGGDNPTGFIYRSLFTPFKEYLGAGIGSRLGQDGKTIRYNILNANLLVFFQIAYRDIFKGDYWAERIFVETIRYSRESFFDFTISQLPENRFCYEITIPIFSEEDPMDRIKTYLQEDIRRTFNLTAYSEKRVVECYTLKAAKEISKFKTKGGEPSLRWEKNSKNKKMVNEPVSVLINLMESILQKLVLDETGINYNIDLDFPDNIKEFNVQQWKQFLKTKGLILEPAKKEMEVVVITDKVK